MIELNSMDNVARMINRVRQLTPTLGHAEVIAYTNWEDPNGFREIPNKIKAEFDFSKGYSFKGFTTDDLFKVYRFCNWDDNIILLPLYLYPYLPIGMTLVTISGRIVTVQPNYMNLKSGDPNYIDSDHRGGALAYGFSKDALAFDDSLT